MHQSLVEARKQMKYMKLNKAQVVIDEILKTGLSGLIEIGLFGSVTRGDFTCESDVDIYLVFEEALPERTIKGRLRSLAEENECDLVFMKETDFVEPQLLQQNIEKNHQVIWRREENDKK